MWGWLLGLFFRCWGCAGILFFLSFFGTEITIPFKKNNQLSNEEFALQRKSNHTEKIVKTTTKMMSNGKI